MPFDPQIHHRWSIRLKGYDYSQPGGYFVTIVAQSRECLFSYILDGKIHLTNFGLIVQHSWLGIPRHYPHVGLDEFCIMPNHIHGIILLREDTGRGGSVSSNKYLLYETMAGSGSEPVRTQTHPVTVHARHGLPEIVRALKSFSARRINAIRQTPGLPVWQRNYYEHIIRDENEMNKIRSYIEDNPLRWELDRENPHNLL